VNLGDVTGQYGEVSLLSVQELTNRSEYFNIVSTGVVEPRGINESRSTGDPGGIDEPSMDEPRSIDKTNCITIELKVRCNIYGLCAW
jgi:hypothetical protein